MTVIAMTREMGSRGRDVATGVAEALGLRVIQHELVEHVAQKMQLSESSVNHLLEGTDSLFERWGVDRTDLSRYTTEEILELANQDDVLFRGWGATRILKPVQHALGVRVCASDEAREKEILARIGIDDINLARKEINRNDAAHDRVMAHIFQADWRDPREYDLVLNTDHVSIDTAVATIVGLVRSSDFQATEASKSQLRDLMIEVRIRRVLREDEVTQRANPSFYIDLESGTGRVSLTGVVFDHDFRFKAVELVSAVPGVTEVIDEMVVPGPMQVGP